MAAERFQIRVSDEVLADLEYRLKAVRLPAPIVGSDWENGTDSVYLESLIAYWRDHFDWRAQEAKLNRFAHYRSNIDGTDIHFIHERGKGPNPLPIVLTHGWPDSFFRYHKMIPMLTDPASYGGKPEDSFDVIVPSLPGFGFSGYPERAGINNSHISALWAKLMTEELGYGAFAAAGGDIGSGVTRYLAASRPELLIGIHLTDIGIIRSLLNPGAGTELTAEERQYQQNARDWIAREGAYMSIQSTKPRTLAYGLSDSPAGLAGWLIEKFHAWSDCNGDLRKSFSEDELLTNIMIYWVTNTIGSAAQIYHENSSSLPPLGLIEVPTGLALFPADILLPPKEWAQRNLNITRWTEMPHGGHFTAWEAPGPLAEDIRAFFRPLRQAAQQ
ncbi:epoxide hydrolase family protein [Paenibacillus typhae]|uniref:epoxide hydrolase family protein n=1 Tax=Paenibacillus typhae TaxID=1174501 RepID=UPI001C8E93F3|nr:epoxide hydrolase family protein [Paenibacillus typhae]MBY0013685.1 epoxide hydrolase [Paenibacillus typhae]